MAKLKNSAVIICFTLFLILLIVGIAFTSVFSIAFSFIIGGVGYAIVDCESIEENYETIKNKHKN